MSSYKHIKVFEEFISGSVGGKRSPRWQFFSEKLKRMNPKPEIVSSPEDPNLETLSWGSTVDPSEGYVAAISSPSAEFPREEIVFWLENPTLLQKIKIWWERKGYKMIPGEIPSSGDNPENTPRVYINFDESDRVVRDLTSFFKEFPY